MFGSGLRLASGRVTMESVLGSRATVASTLQLPIVRIGLDTTALQKTKCKSTQLSTQRGTVRATKGPRPRPRDPAPSAAPDRSNLSLSLSLSKENETEARALSLSLSLSLSETITPQKTLSLCAEDSRSLRGRRRKEVSLRDVEKKEEGGSPSVEREAPRSVPFFGVGLSFWRRAAARDSHACQSACRSASSSPPSCPRHSARASAPFPPTCGTRPPPASDTRWRFAFPF